MSKDFFTSLVDRHTGVVPTVEPRIGSRYENVPAIGLPRFELFADTAGFHRPAAGTEPRAEVGEPDGAPVAAKHRRHSSPPAEPRTGTQSAGYEVLDTQKPGARPQPSRPHSPAGPAPQTPAGLRHEDDWKRRIDSLLARLNAPDRSQGSLQSPARGPVASQALPGSRAEAEPADGHTGKTKSLASRAAADELGSPLPAPFEPAQPAANPAEPDWVNTLQTKLNQRRGPSERTPEPVINVTIGRVEVKAIRQNSQATPSPRKAPGILSLDDYLAGRQREGQS